MSRLCALLAMVLASAPCHSAENAVRPKRIVVPQYTFLARLTGAQGEVRLAAIIDTDGAVRDASVVRTENRFLGFLAPAAIDALKRWTFDGCAPEAEPCRFEVTFSFILDGVCSNYECDIEDAVIELPNSVTVRATAFKAIVD